MATAACMNAAADHVTASRDAARHLTGQRLATCISAKAAAKRATTATAASHFRLAAPATTAARAQNGNQVRSLTMLHPCQPYIHTTQCMLPDTSLSIVEHMDCKRLIEGPWLQLHCLHHLSAVMSDACDPRRMVP